MNFYTFKFTVGAGAADCATKVKFLYKAWKAFQILDKLTDEMVVMIRMMPMQANMIIRFTKDLSSI